MSTLLCIAGPLYVLYVHVSAWHPEPNIYCYLFSRPLPCHFTFITLAIYGTSCVHIVMCCSTPLPLHASALPIMGPTANYVYTVIYCITIATTCISLTQYEANCVYIVLYCRTIATTCISLTQYGTNCVYIVLYCRTIATTCIRLTQYGTNCVYTVIYCIAGPLPLLVSA